MDTKEERTPVAITLSDVVTLMVWLGLPYIVVGIFWADAHRDQLENVYGMDKFLSYLGEVLAWPLLIFADLSLR